MKETDLLKRITVNPEIFGGKPIRGGLKLLLDSCIWPGAKTELERGGHEVEWVGDWNSDPGDAAILAHAAQNSQIVGL